MVDLHQGTVMITCIREVRRAKGLTLQDVAERCSPPTTAQTIGRLETGTRTVSIGWLNRIAAALGVEAAQLLRSPEKSELPVVAVLGPEGAAAPRHERIAPLAQPQGDTMAMLVEVGSGDYRHGDIVWLYRLDPEHFGRALNRDVLVPRPGDRFVFARLIGREGTRLHLLPPGHAARQQVVADAPWLALATRLIRSLA